MYLKSIEMHGFKSFANKIVLEFHNGITGIVGPNGSGKSNVGDAVRWVLGEQSAKQLRGASMQDVIFAGTENRKPLSFAYVAITLDNSDHVLPIEYDEVTIARRVYRSGESEYLLNKTPCRLKDITELFYDTGIGKEGYSIIGQGQIERILSGKPEERRELFDEAVGIVKFKKRKNTAIKKLSEERDNLVRVNDILNELERQVGPLERQAETAKEYLKKKETLKTLDLNLFLVNQEEQQQELDKILKDGEITNSQLSDAHEEDERIKKRYEDLDQEIRALDEAIEAIHNEEGESTVTKGKLENQISLLEEQIRSAETSDETINKRIWELDQERETFEKDRDVLQSEKAELQEALDQVETRLNEATQYYQTLTNEIKECNEGITKDQNDLMALVDGRGNIKSKQQRLSTMLEQMNIRKAQLNQRLLSRKTEESQFSAEVEGLEKVFKEKSDLVESEKKKKVSVDSKVMEWQDKRKEAERELSSLKEEYTRLNSHLETLRNIAERYEGYGNSIKKVMNQKDQNPGLLGVVSDLIHVKKKYEIAIETALGGNIQNIVTEDEATAKEMINFLKKNHFGRATFLPLTSVKGRGIKNDDVLSEKGVLGLCSDVVDYDAKYKDVASYLLGRVVLCETVDDALRIAKKYHYSMHIVTLEGEYLSPGGSMTGGAFKNTSNLLGRQREIDEITERLSKIEKNQKEKENRISEIETAMELLADDRKENEAALQQAILDQNSAEINLKRAKEQREEIEKAFQALNDESSDIEGQIKEITLNSQQAEEEMKESLAREEEIQKHIEELTSKLDEKTYMETSATRTLSEVQLEESSQRQKVTFVDEKLTRALSDIEKNENSKKELLASKDQAKEDIEKKKHDIEEIRMTLAASDEHFKELNERLKEVQKQKEEKNKSYKEFFEEKEKISNQITNLEKEIMRLEQNRDRVKSALDYQINYIWEEYELTPHNAKEYRNEEYSDLSAMKKEISGIKDDIRRMGNVNVNAIEEYKEISQRYEFLKGQHDDLVDAEARLVELIDELDSGMREQFTKGFADIQREFDKAFKELFGGGKGTLELIEDEDILEAGIRIIAQPPGKKLQNMMQLSGGEKSLTAIALLFAIQNLKPSPFCLLDEIEAALDDSNVGRFANYLHKLTKNTQFIIITHRRGTMNAADRLYGITMQEKGISTLVSVNLIEDDLDE